MNELVEESQRLAKMYWQSRVDGGKSQEYMALSMGISKNTVRNWENGTSSPTFKQLLAWFRVLGLSPLQYLLSAIFYDSVGKIKPDSPSEEVIQSLHIVVDSLPLETQNALLYILRGVHGSEVVAVINLFLAYLHCDMRSRVSVAVQIARNYEICKATGTLVGEDYILPDMKLLYQSIEWGHNAVINNQTGYTSSIEDSVEENKVKPIS